MPDEDLYDELQDLRYLLRKARHAAVVNRLTWEQRELYKGLLSAASTCIEAARDIIEPSKLPRP